MGALSEEPIWEIGSRTSSFQLVLFQSSQDPAVLLIWGLFVRQLQKPDTFPFSYDPISGGKGRRAQTEPGADLERKVARFNSERQWRL